LKRRWKQFCSWDSRRPTGQMSHLENDRVIGKTCDAQQGTVSCGISVRASGVCSSFGFHWRSQLHNPDLKSLTLPCHRHPPHRHPSVFDPSAASPVITACVSFLGLFLCISASTATLAQRFQCRRSSNCIRSGSIGWLQEPYVPIFSCSAIVYLTPEVLAANF